MKTLNLLILVLAINLMPVKAQEIGEVWSCQTADDINYKSIIQSNICTRNAYDTNPKIINIYVHVIRQSSGYGGLSTSEINSTLNILYNDYSSANITFNEIGRSYINNSTFFSGIDYSNYSSLISTNSHSNAIDIYFLSPIDSFSRASGIPGTALAIGGAYAGTSVLSHETGHTLGLYHTHSGSGCYDYANCSENIDASNCSTCGDLVCDTPADPCLSGKVTTACIYIGDSRYTPDVNNIMSYAPPSCLTHFSNGQIERLHDMITNASVLQNVWSPINISGSSSLCNSSSSYFIDAPPSGETISWSTSNNITRLSSQGANPCTFNAVSSNIVGNGRITAMITINGNTFTIDKDIWVGKPQLYTYDENGNETTSGKVVTVSAGTAVTFEAYCYDFTATLDWDVTPSTANYSISGNSCTVMATTEFISIVAKANNECGEYMMLNTLSGTSGGGFPLNVNVYPNPASTTINIEMLSIAKLSQDEIYNEIQLYDNLMNLKKQFKVKGNYSTIDVSNLKRGFYYLRLKSNKNVYTKQILIEK